MESLGEMIEWHQGDSYESYIVALSSAILLLVTPLRKSYMPTETTPTKSSLSVRGCFNAWRRADGLKEQAELVVGNCC